MGLGANRINAAPGVPRAGAVGIDGHPEHSVTYTQAVPALSHEVSTVGILCNLIRGDQTIALKVLGPTGVEVRERSLGVEVMPAI